MSEGEMGTVQARDAEIPRPILLSTLPRHFDITYDCVPYAVGVYHNKAEAQAEATQRLMPFRLLYDGYPDRDWRLRDYPLSLWELMRASTGLDISLVDLAMACPDKCAEIPENGTFADVVGDDDRPCPDLANRLLVEGGGTTSWEKARLHGVPRYVVVNTGTGRGGRTKQAPPEVWKAVVSFLESDGVRAVQVGHARDERVEDAIDRRGLRLPLTCRLLQDALCVVTTESFPAYLSAGMDKSAVVLYGSTPMQVFTMGAGNVDLIHTEKGEGGEHVACPLGCCFRLPGYGDRCLLPKDEQRADGYCLNVPHPAEAARAVSALAKAVLQYQRGELPAQQEGRA